LAEESDEEYNQPSKKAKKIKKNKLEQYVKKNLNLQKLIILEKITANSKFKNFVNSKVLFLYLGF
jgi:hypothetical protein